MEPFVFFTIAAMYIKMVTLAKLYQDKVCVNNLHYDVNFCKNFTPHNKEELEMKATVLADAQLYSMYQALISTLPNTIASFFVGNWIDNYDNSMKYALLITAIGGTFEALLLILNSLYFEWGPAIVLTSFIPTALSGSFVFVLMAAFSYVPKVTAPHLRPIRYAILELAFFFGAPTGQYIGGIIIRTTPIGTNSLRNYVGVFIFSLCCYSFCIIWVLVVFRDKETSEFLIDEDANESGESERRIANNQKWYMVPKNIFICENALNTIRTCNKQRPNKKKLQLWMFIMALYTIAIFVYGTGAILFPFTERVFDWDESKFSEVNSINSIIGNLIMITAVFTLAKKFKVKDLRLAVIGATAGLLQTIIRGSLLNEVAFYMSYYVGSLSSLSSIGMRSYISRLVPKDELGKIFSMIASLESTIELVSGIVLSALFRVTVLKGPGILFQILCIPLLYPLIAIIVVELYYEGYNEDNSTENDENKNIPIVSPSEGSTN
ncbi:hypothetical protein B4U80_13239 [Leptotrombidium deliense]|uniref:Uncharacterized protein n=1 Tax=Leptotrombidium deliense TaxID=299467 RepID=A0A443S9R5_9ACAR|nr:hypothetical protein B4U80_13239 [Leptotrombidium deliense]